MTERRGERRGTVVDYDCDFGVVFIGWIEGGGGGCAGGVGGSVADRIERRGGFRGRETRGAGGSRHCRGVGRSVVSS